MDAFVWDQNFVTGLSGVDEQHHQLVDVFNELNDALFSKSGDAELVLGDTFARVVDYARYHFRDEEVLMHAEGVDSRHVAIHRAAHEQFVSQLDAMWKRRGSVSQPGEALVGFLTSWLGLHILGVDQSMARQIELIRSGVSPADAFEREAEAHDNAMEAVLKLVANLYHVLTRQNEDLVEANRVLEARVNERTAELADAHRQLQQAYLKLQEHARLDGLLHIANREYFDARLQNAWASGLRRQQPVGLLMIDVDQFKRYNDSYGHQAGDACLQKVAGAVGGALLRATDLLARYGGEELAVILPDTDEAGVAAVAQRIVSAVAALGIAHRSSDAAPVVTVSVGAASRLPAAGSHEQSLIARADAALYLAKESGRNRWVAAD